MRVSLMSDTILAYLVSFGIIAAGVSWIVAGLYYPAPSAVCIIVGLLTIVVGLASLFGELRP